MIQVRDVLGRARPLAVAAIFAAAALLPAIALPTASAGNLSERSLMLSSSKPSGVTGAHADAGHANNGDKVSHTYTFKAETAGTIRSMSFSVWDNAFGYLTGTGSLAAGTGFSGAAAPDAVVVSGAQNVTFDTTGAQATWSISDATGITVAAGDEVTVTFAATPTEFFVNPNAAYGTSNGTFFVRIQTYSTDNMTGGVVDGGTVTNAVTPTIDIETRVKEVLKFSVEADARNTDGSGTGANPGPAGGAATAACEALTGPFALAMGESAEKTLDSGVQYNAFSYFRVATNSAHGTKLFYGGDTLTSGTESIDAMTTAAAGTVGTEQFGLRVATDNTHFVDAEGDLTVLPDYAGVNYKFNDASATAPEQFAESSDKITCATGVIEYIGNIAPDTAAGIYRTSITYIASPAY